MSEKIMRELAKKSFIALRDPYHSIDKVFPQVIDKVTAETFSYIGVKNRPEIPRSLIATFEDTNRYGLHTLDAHSLGGRAIDTRLTNPITGHPMTGSSSGTAINVLAGINDLGIGTDGGGSVLAPAMSLNLFSFISPSICKAHTDTFKKRSTDTHSFTPSIGFITREFDELNDAIRVVLPIPSTDRGVSTSQLLTINHSLEDVSVSEDLKIVDATVDLDDSRGPLIAFVKTSINNYDCILSKEGPIDFEGLGDTVLGHLGSNAKAYQHRGNKGLIRVANMADAAALTVPTGDHATSYVLLCEDTPEKIARMLELASTLAKPQDALLKRYFLNFDHYFPESY